MAYVPSAFDTTRPVDADIAETAQLEFRTIKSFYQCVVTRAYVPVTSVNTVVGVNLFSTTIPAGLLGTNKRLRLQATGGIVNTTGAAQTTNMAFSYAGANVGTAVIPIPGNGSFAWKCEGELFNINGNANTQAGFFEVRTYGTPSTLGAGVAAISLIGSSIDTFGVPSGIAQTLALAVANGVASPNYATFMDGAILEWLN
jgi:hypothetical protein